MEPASGSVPEERAAGKRMVRGARDPGIHVLWLAEEGVPGSGIREGGVLRGGLCKAAAAAETVASVQCGELRVDIHAGADTETIRAIIQTLKSC